jgi:hypothetical protein
MKKITIFHILLFITLVISITTAVLLKFSILNSVLLLFAVPTILQIILSCFKSKLDSIALAYNRKVNKEYRLNEVAIKQAKIENMREFKKGKHLVWASSQKISDKLYNDKILPLIKKYPKKTFYYINSKRHNLNGK